MKKLFLFTMATAFSAVAISGLQPFPPQPNTPQGKAFGEYLDKKKAQTNPPAQAPVTTPQKPATPPPANAQKAVPNQPTKVQSTKAPN